MKLRTFISLLFVAAGIIAAAEDVRPVVDASKVAVEKIANGALPTFHIVGDSTVRSGGAGAGLWGWGERITPLFDTNKINVVDRKSTRLNSSHRCISYAVFCLKKKKNLTSSHSTYICSTNFVLSLTVSSAR